MSAFPAFAQTNPNVVEFKPSPSHFAVLSDGRPVVSRYELEFYQAGSTAPAFLSLDVGKPAPQADGMIRVDYTKLLTSWPYPGTQSEIRVAAFGPNGMELSLPSNAFVYSCTFSLPVVSQNVAASGGSGSFSVNATTSCPWTAKSSASWLTISAGASGSGTGTVSFSASANGTTSSRSGTITVQNLVFTVTQAASSTTNVPPTVSLTAPVNGATFASPTAITLSATASDSGGINRVEFFQNSVKVGSDSTSPYSVSWTPPTTGTYQIQAVAYDNAGVSSASVVSTITVGSSTSTTTAIGDMTWVSAVNGWGPPERNRSNGEQGANDGRTITLAGKTYASGLGVHANSDVRYTLNALCSTLTADIGVDDEVGSKGSVIFKVLGDGATLFTSGTLTGSSKTQSITVNVSGVKTLALVVTDGGNGIGSDHADWANARLSCSGPLTGGQTVRYVSDLTWSSATNGWGPAERDRSNGEQGAADGLPLTINGKVYNKGIGTHAASDLRIPLNGSCTKFEADLGIDEEVGANGTVIFQVFTDGLKIFDSGVITGASATKPVSLDVTGKGELALMVTNGGDNIDYDHADWGDARVTCTP